MSTSSKSGFFGNLRKDLPASVVVFLVALPLCLGIALASGAPPFSGIIAGIIGGTVVALLSGSPLGVSGPAAGLAVIVFNAIGDLGAFDTFLLAVIIAGLIQVLLGALRFGIIGYYFPNSVIKGMLSGIGIIIFIKQIPHAFGYDKDPEGDMDFFQVDGHNAISELGYMLDAITPGAVIITVVSLAILILWEQPFFRRNKIIAAIPGAFVAVMAGVFLNLFFKGTSLNIASDHLVSIPVSESIGGFFSQFTFPDFSQWNNPKVYAVAALMAAVASLETLLCVEASDKMDPEKRVTPPNRELFAQGTGNVVSGLIGGLPITQVIVRSSANVQAGGKTKASAFFHGMMLLVCVMTIPGVLNLIPLASLAAILFVVGYKLAKPALFKQMYAKGWAQFIPFVITVVGVTINLLGGVIAGLVVAIFQILYNNYRTPYHFNPDEVTRNEPIRIHLSEDVSFLNKASIMHSFKLIPDDSHVIIDATLTKSIHPDVLEIIEDFTENAKTRNIEVELRGNIAEQLANPVDQLHSSVKKSAIRRRFDVLGSIFSSQKSSTESGKKLF